MRSDRSVTVGLYVELRLVFTGIMSQRTLFHLILYGLITIFISVGSATARQGWKDVVPPLVVASPTEEVFFHTARVILTCRAEGTPPPTIRWLHNDLPVDDPTGLRRCASVHEDQEERLHIWVTNCWDNLQHMRDVTEGYIQCLAENEGGTAFGLPSKFTYAYVEHVAVPPDARVASVVEGDTIRLDCDAIRSVPRPQYTWTHCARSVCQGVPPRTAPAFNDRHWKDSKTGTLVIVNVTSADAGSYECEAYNHHVSETLSDTWTIIVLEEGAGTSSTHEAVLMDVKVSPAYQAVEIGKTAILTCFQSGRPQVSVTWEFLRGHSCPSHGSSSTPQQPQFVPVPPVVGTSLMIHNQVLRFLRVSEQAQGCYQCVTEGPGRNGVCITRMFLDILAPPVFDFTPWPWQVSIGDHAFFWCRAVGDPQPMLTWFIDDVMYNPDLHTRWRVAGDKRSLGLFHAHATDTCVVTCLATNPVGQEMAVTYLTVIP